jgi:cellulose synthase/poly-beta-1,6-N-acetylglucosamine synthase-like glycosyltransferase
LSLFITLLSVFMGIFLSLALFYLFFWAMAYFFGHTKKIMKNAEPRKKFAFVVPAHNEEAGINDTLASLLAVDYPLDLFDVIVVADNCDDETALVAEKAGAAVLERHSEAEKGKGFALKYAFQKLLSKEYDAFVVIDADSIVDRNFLSVMNSYLMAGHSAVQALYGISNPNSSPLTRIFQVGNILENHFFYEGKTKIGFPAMLRGNGMCFTREILVNYPWDAFSVVEDTEYTIKLIREGVNIPFATETRVLAKQPESVTQAHSQRVRWASGNLKITKGYGFKLVAEGMSKRKFFLADTGISLLVLSKPLLILISLAMGALSLFNVLLFQSGQLVLIWAVVLFGAQFVYLMLGVCHKGFKGQKLRFLLQAPLYLGWLAFVSVLGLAGYKADLWVRTKRS